MSNRFISDLLGAQVSKITITEASLADDWMQEFAVLDKKLRYIDYSLDEVVPHLQRDMDWILQKLPNDAYARMQMDRIKYHIIGTVLQERRLAVKQHQDEVDDWAMQQMIPIIWEDA